MFLGDFTLSLIMRATTEQVNGVWQGACYPFREGLSTGFLDVQFTPEGNLLCGGTNRGWPVRGIEPFALERLDWTGEMPFEIERISITPDGFQVSFTKPVEARNTGADVRSYRTRHVHAHLPRRPTAARRSTRPRQRCWTCSALGGRTDGHAGPERARAIGHVHEFDLGALRSQDGEELLASGTPTTQSTRFPLRQERGRRRSPDRTGSAPRSGEPVKWLTYEGGEGTRARGSTSS